MSEWHNIRLANLSAKAKQALENKLAASKVAAQANREWIAVLTQDLGALPEGKRYAVSLNLKFQQIGIKIVDADSVEETEPKAKKQSFEEWKKAQLDSGHSV